MENRLNKAIEISEQKAHKMNSVAHHYDHADQVRKNVVELARDENLSDEETRLLEIAALWHDVGLDYVDDRSKHPEKSAEMFEESFPDESLLSLAEKTKIGFLIKYHDKYAKALEASSDQRLLTMLRILIDADTLELLGERGFNRAEETADSRGWKIYDNDNPLGQTFGFSSSDFDKRFAMKKAGEIPEAIEPTLVGQLNFQISCADLLYTGASKRKSSEGVKFLRNKIMEIAPNLIN